MKRIYLDNAAVTPVHKDVLRAQVEAAKKFSGNPSSIHAEGYAAKKELMRARGVIASFFGGNSDEVVFTGSGTEANNLAIIGLAEALVAEGKKYEELHFLTTSIEHASVRECAEYLKKKGVAVEYVGVDEEGRVDLKVLKEKIRPETFLVSVMYVNNEIGTIEPLTEVAKVIRYARKQHGGSFPYFHTDACQAGLFHPVDAQIIGADLITIDAQKMYGPRGIGALWKRRSLVLSPIIHGGGQEKGLRSGTENIPLIAGFARAVELVLKQRGTQQERVSVLRDYFISELEKIEGVVVNGSKTERVANNVNISVPGRDNEFIVLKLDAKGIACGTKSSCLRDEEESYVVRALQKGEKVARTSIRFSLGYDTTKRDIDAALDAFRKIIS
jgi:cysteine desulfurase